MRRGLWVRIHVSLLCTAKVRSDFYHWTFEQIEDLFLPAKEVTLPWVSVRNLSKATKSSPKNVSGFAVGASTLRS